MKVEARLRITAGVFDTLLEHEVNAHVVEIGGDKKVHELSVEDVDKLRESVGVRIEQVKAEVGLQLDALALQARVRAQEPAPAEL